MILEEQIKFIKGGKKALPKILNYQYAIRDREYWILHKKDGTAFGNKKYAPEELQFLPINWYPQP